MSITSSSSTGGWAIELPDCCRPAAAAVMGPGERWLQAPAFIMPVPGGGGTTGGGGRLALAKTAALPLALSRRVPRLLTVAARRATVLTVHTVAPGVAMYVIEEPTAAL